MKVLKKGVLDEQAKSNEYREALKEKEKCLRKGELEIDSLTFRNQQLTRRVSVLQDELEALQVSYEVSLKHTNKKQALFAYIYVSNHFSFMLNKLTYNIYISLFVALILCTNVRKTNDWSSIYQSSVEYSDTSALNRITALIVLLVIV